MKNPTADYAALIERREVVVCVGSGGVGKTTTSAVIALHAALEGRRALVLTIDPARRLANSLGVSELDNEPRQIPLEQFSAIGLEPRGELWAMMLDMKQSFDGLVNRYAPDAQARQKILDNRLYQYFSSSLAGTQEYAAAERLYDLHMSGEWDLIVLDTPPTTHALDFLEAPNRLIEAINNKALQFLYKPGMLGTNYMLKTLSKFTGGEMLTELGTFLEAFSTLFNGFRERADSVRRLMTSSATTFTVITAPNAGTIEEAIYFYERLGAEHVRVGGFVVNRVHPGWVPRAELKRPTMTMAAELAALGGPLGDMDDASRKALAHKLRDNAADFQVLADLDHESIERLRGIVLGDVPVLPVPYFSRDIHSLGGLNHVREALFIGPAR